MNNADYKGMRKENSFLQSKMHPGIRILTAFRKDYRKAYAEEWAKTKNGNYCVVFYEDLILRKCYYNTEGNLKQIWLNLNLEDIPELIIQSILKKFGENIMFFSVWKEECENPKFKVVIDLPDRSRHKLVLNSKGMIKKSELIFVINSGENR